MKTVRECIVTAMAIVSIGLLAAYALKLGNDGTVLLSCVTIIAGLAGYQVGKSRGTPKNGEPPAKTPLPPT